MPSPKHPCAHPGCDAMVARKEAVTCRKHITRTAEWIANQAAATKGRKHSEEAKKLMSKTRSGDQPIDRTCKHCGKDFKATKASKKTEFCSRACGYANRHGENAHNWNPEMPICKCGTCGKEFRVKSTIQDRKFCSRHCAGIGRKRRQKNKSTDIELMMASALTCAGIEFVEQYTIPTVGIPDFFIPSANLVVYCDGDYWHNLPKHVEKDKRDNIKLDALGFKVARFWGKEIKASPAACVERLVNRFSSCNAGK